jgi:hypothetical protein
MNLKEEFGTGFEQNVHFWIMHPYPPKADRSIVRGYWVFVFMESRTKDYASEYNELYWFQKKFSSIGDLAGFFNSQTKVLNNIRRLKC